MFVKQNHPYPNRHRFWLALLVGGILIASLAVISPVQAAQFDLAAALANAQPGDVLDVPPGVYPGLWVIDKSVHLRGLTGGDGSQAILDGQGAGTVLTINASGVVVENLTIRNSGDKLEREDSGIYVHGTDVQILSSQIVNVLFGIQASTADRLVLRDNFVGGMALDIARRGDGIRLWESNDCLLEGNTVQSVRDTIFYFSENTTIRNNIFRDNRYGIHTMYTNGIHVENNHLLDNSVGAYLMYSQNVGIRGNNFEGNRGPSGYGLALKDMDGVIIEENYYIDNRVGMFFDNSPSNVDLSQQVERNVLAFNDVGILMMPAVKRNILRQNTFLDNLEQVGVKGGGSNPGDELGGNQWDGNFWSDYLGYDATGEGVGDIAYHAESLFENLADGQPNLRLFYFSPAQQAIDFAARAFPVIRPKPKLTDEAPIILPVLPTLAPLLLPPPSRIGWLAAALLLGALAIFAGEIGGWVPGRRARSLPADEQTSPSLPPPSQTDFPLPEGTPMLSIQNLTKRYPRPGRAWWSDETVTAVDDLSFDLPAGSSVALWGVNGAGKTTVLKCLLGLLTCQGDLRLNGYDLGRDGRTARRFLGYVPQEMAFHNDLSVAESCRFYARLKDVSDGRIPVVLALVGLTGQEKKAVGALSGGMKQRLALALALLADPPVLLLDEPTSNLDAATRDEFIDLLVQLRNSGKTLLFTSHYADEVERLAGRVLVLQDGRLAAQGAPAEVLRRRQTADDRPQIANPLSSAAPTTYDATPLIGGLPSAVRGLSPAVAYSLEEAVK